MPIICKNPISIPRSTIPNKIINSPKKKCTPKSIIKRQKASAQIKTDKKIKRKKIKFHNMGYTKSHFPHIGAVPCQCQYTKCTRNFPLY